MLLNVAHYLSIFLSIAQNYSALLKVAQRYSLTTKYCHALRVPVLHAIWRLPQKRTLVQEILKYSKTSPIQIVLLSVTQRRSAFISLPQHCAAVLRAAQHCSALLTDYWVLLKHNDLASKVPTLVPTNINFPRTSGQDSKSNIASLSMAIQIFFSSGTIKCFSSFMNWLSMILMSNCNHKTSNWMVFFLYELTEVCVTFPYCPVQIYAENWY